MGKLKNIFVNFITTKTGLILTQPAEEIFLGEKYRVNKGAIRHESDYDDAWLFALSQKAKSVFDVGCNVGQSALLIMHSKKVKDIVLIDPNPTALSQAASNLIHNHREKNARFVCAFASDKPSENIEFFSIGAGAAGSMYSGHAKTASKNHSSYFVPTITLDDISQNYSLTPDLVKIDTEGAESQVLYGARNIAANQVTKFFVEMHSQPELNMFENAERVINWCLENQYQAWYLKEKQLLTDPAQIAHRGRCHLLLLPIDELFPQYLLPIKQGESLEVVQSLLNFGN